MDATTFEQLIDAVRLIAHGPTSGPTGLELVAMSLNGSEGAGENSVADAIRDGLHDIAEAIRETR